MINLLVVFFLVSISAAQADTTGFVSSEINSIELYEALSIVPIVTEVEEDEAGISIGFFSKTITNSKKISGITCNKSEFLNSQNELRYLKHECSFSMLNKTVLKNNADTCSETLSVGKNLVITPIDTDSFKLFYDALEVSEIELNQLEEVSALSIDTNGVASSVDSCGSTRASRLIESFYKEIGSIKFQKYVYNGQVTKFDIIVQ